ncbi:MAG: HAD family hydrolase [Ruminococcaceae bacterium]|nr:HAD family hydrolase [Oscillospiraceae bacterium]
MNYGSKPKMVLFDVGGTLFEDGKCYPLEGLAKLRLLAKNPEATTDERLFQLWEEYMDEIDVPRKSKSGVGLDIPLCAPLKYAIMHSGLEFDLSTYELEELFDRYNSTREFVPGIRELLSTLENLGIRAAVISNNMMSGESLELAVKHWLPDSKMEFCLTSADLLFTKPFPRIFTAAVGKAHLAPEDCWYCGDGKVPDVDGGSSAGLTPVLIDVKMDSPCEMRFDCAKGEYMTVNSWNVLADHLKTL